MDKSRVGAFGQVRAASSELAREPGSKRLTPCVRLQGYGGYVTALLLSGEESPVKCGAALSPMSDFELCGR